MSLADQILTDLRSQRQFLLDEFEVWKERADPDGDLRQHHTQVERITRTLEGVLESALDGTALRLRGSGPETAALDELPRLRRALGSVHLLWNYFRDKLAQRDTGFFSHHLGAADDLAWSCYLPFLETIVAAAEAEAGADGPRRRELQPEQLKEPPLLFYSSERSPFAQARTSVFHPEGLDAKDVGIFSRALRHLPVPVVGFPWPQARSMPPLVFVGHEVGHVVAEDLGLERELEGLIAGLGLPDDRTAVWREWADETFADVFGVVATGSVYVDRLARLLAADKPGVRNERIDPNQPGAYPSRVLRMEVCHRVQRSIGLVPDPTWRRTYGAPSGDSADFADDVEPVADALLNGPYERLGGRGLADVLSWTPDDDEAAAEVAAEILAGADPPVPFAVRTWIAASVRAQATEPVKFASEGLDTKFAELIVAARTQGVRSEDCAALRGRMFAVAKGEAIFERVSPSLKRLDRAAGAQLAAMMEL